MKDLLDGAGKRKELTKLSTIRKKKVVSEQAMSREHVDIIDEQEYARVAELADALDLGSSGLNHRGSNPLSRIHPKSAR
jgi:hypothetical protein